MVVARHRESFSADDDNFRGRWLPHSIELLRVRAGLQIDEKSPPPPLAPVVRAPYFPGVWPYYGDLDAKSPGFLSHDDAHTFGDSSHSRREGAGVPYFAAPPP